MATIRLHGIPNCDTVKRARAWLAGQGVAYEFHDFKKAGVPDALSQWIEVLGWERLINRAGTTWRKLDAATQAAVHDAPSARALMLEQPSIIKRPVVEWRQEGTLRVTVGFDAAQWSEPVQNGPTV